MAFLLNSSRAAGLRRPFLLRRRIPPIRSRNVSSAAAVAAIALARSARKNPGRSSGSELARPKPLEA